MTVDGKTYLSSDEPVGEYIRLFGEFSIQEDLRRRPSATANGYGSPAEICFTGGYEFSEPDVGEASIALRIQKDVFLDSLMRPTRKRNHPKWGAYLFQVPVDYSTRVEILQSMSDVDQLRYRRRSESRFSGTVKPESLPKKHDWLLYDFARTSWLVHSASTPSRFRVQDGWSSTQSIGQCFGDLISPTPRPRQRNSWNCYLVVAE